MHFSINQEKHPKILNIYPKKKFNFLIIQFIFVQLKIKNKNKILIYTQTKTRLKQRTVIKH